MTRGRRRGHYQWNMDIVGVEGVEAEAELLAAITTFFARLGVTSEDVGIKVSSRKVLQAVLARFDVPEESFAPVCVVVDKIEKLPREKVVEELAALGVDEGAIDGILAAMELRSVGDLEALLGEDSDAVSDLAPSSRTPRRTATPIGSSSTPPSSEVSRTTRAWCSRGSIARESFAPSAAAADAIASSPRSAARTDRWSDRDRRRRHHGAGQR